MIEDEKAIRDMIKFSFLNSRFVLSEAEDVFQANTIIFDRTPDLILLDWMLPVKNGLEFIKELRTEEMTANLPIIMLTAKSSENAIIKALNAGADDYIIKPFSPKELLARINAVLRRTGTTDKTLLEIANLSMNLAAHRVTYKEKKLIFGPLEFKLLHFFMTHVDQVFSRSQLLDNVWGFNSFVEERTVDVHIQRLRKKLEKVEANNFIQTIRGSGYIFSICN